MVMGSPSTPNLGGSGAPSDACVWGASSQVGSDGVGAGRDGALSTPAGGWELEEPTKQRVKRSDVIITDTRTSQGPEINYEPGSLEAAPVLSLFAMDGWACSRVRFSLRKDRYMSKRRGTGRQKPQHREGLPHGENSSPPSAPTGGPRATPRQGSRPLEGRRWPRCVSSRLTGAGTGAPAADLSFLGGRCATAGQWPRRLGPGMTALPERRGRARHDLTDLGRGRGIGARTVGSAWAPRRSFRPRSVDVALRWTPEDPVKTRRHPLGVLTVLVIVVIFLAGGLFLRLSPLPGLGPARL
jgi:hypothetical protein